jgi:uncharacterized membrane protein
MKAISLLKQAAFMGVMAAVAAGVAAPASADEASKEKCYGVARAGKNDCKGHANSCAGQASKDGEGFLAVPKGLCEKLIGGTTTEPTS